MASAYPYMHAGPPGGAADRDPFNPTSSPWSSTATLTPRGAGTRAAPATGAAASSRAPPPAYASVVRRVYPARFSLGPLMMICSIFSTVLLLIFAAASFRSVSRDAGTVKIFDIIQGILYLAAGAVEAIGIAAASTRRPGTARLYSVLCVPAFLAAVGAMVLQVVANAAFKSTIIDTCTKEYTGATVGGSYSTWFWGSVTVGDSNNGTPLSADDARAYCQRINNSGLRTSIFLLVVTLLLGAFFVLVGLGYYAELSRPDLLRQPNQTATNGAYAGAYDVPYNGYNGYGGSAAGYDYGYGQGGAHSYPPPPGPPPGGVAFVPAYGADSRPPKYEGGRGADDDDDDLDAKSPAGPSGSGYAPAAGPSAVQGREQGAAAPTTAPPDADAVARSSSQEHAAPAPNSAPPASRTADV